MAEGEVKSGQSLAEGSAAHGASTDAALEREKKLDAMRRELASRRHMDDAKAEERLRKMQHAAEEKQRREMQQKEHEQALRDLAELGDVRASMELEAAKAWKQNLAAVKQAMVANVSAAFAGMEQYMTTYAQYMSGIEARIQGSGESFADMVSTFKSAIGGSRFVKQTEVLQNLSRLVEAGTSLNLEQRAFLATVASDIATTFNAFDSSLLRIIRLQQQDSTAARLGMEAALTQQLNSMFQDTSYLKDLGTSVRAALLPAISLKEVESGSEFEYIAQTYLGSLSSVGASDSLVTGLATALGQLGSGDITGLQSQQGMYQLLAVAASRAGVDLGTILQQGLSSQNLSKILEAAVRYGQEIAETDSLAARSMYAELFGMSIADLKALMNLGKTSLQTIKESVLSYQGMINETESQLQKLPSRIHLSEQVQNLFDNAMLTAGMTVASNSAMYTTYLISDMLKKATGGIDVPIPIPMTGIMNINIADTMKAGILGAGLLGSMGSILGGAFSTPSLKAFGGSTTVTRGGGYKVVDAGVDQQKSQSATVGGSADDVEGASVASAKEKATETGGEEPEYVKQIRDALCGTEADVTVLSLLQSMKADINILATAAQGLGLNVALVNPMTVGG